MNTVKIKNSDDPGWYPILGELGNMYILGKNGGKIYISKDKTLSYNEYMKQFVVNKDLYNEES